MLKPKKTILTICPSWPGQFKSMINACNADGGYNIVAICQIAKPELVVFLFTSFELRLLNMARYIHRHDNMTILHDLTFTVSNMHQNAAHFALGKFSCLVFWSN
jgi:hypothetical protein